MRAVLSQRTFGLASAFVLLGALAGTATVRGGDEPPISAAKGAPAAWAAARAWSADAELVYVENDEPLDAVGQAPRWGYLFRSDALDRARGYSVVSGRVLQAADLTVRFEAPPIGSEWLDSDAALEAAEVHAGARFRGEERGALAHMILLRGATDRGEPERVSWLVIYRSPGRPSLFVLVDAIEGGVDRTWRG